MSYNMFCDYYNGKYGHVYQEMISILINYMIKNDLLLILSVFDNTDEIRVVNLNDFKH